MKREIAHQWFFPHPPQIVWDYLTRPELLSQWLMENDIKPIVGHKFEFRSKPKMEIGYNGINYCEILEVIPFKQLTYSWKAGPGNGKFTLDTIVTWTLVEKNAGTELNLKHTGFKAVENDIIYKMMHDGWDKHVNGLAERINKDKK
jgi:uncharacterized protein YndB with AHSA1/START domain